MTINEKKFILEALMVEESEQLLFKFTHNIIPIQRNNN
jgi:hypothetical protein